MNTCEICGLSWSNRRQLVNHLDSHEQKTFACGQCTKQFFSKSRLDDHINQAHSKSNKCGKCGAQFSHYSSLNRHTKQAHEGVKIGVCKFCKKEFNKSESTKEVVEAAHQRLDKIWDWYCVKMLEKEAHGEKFLMCINHFNSFNI